MAERLSRAAVSAIACGAFIVLLSFGIRSSFGLFLQPMSLDLGWGREVFALAMAIQNLLWGLSQPFVGAIADKWGTARTIVGGGLLYVVGVYLMSTTSSPAELYFSAGVLVGLGLSGTGFGVVLAAVGRSVPAERRSVALGITTAVGSLGQFLLPPIGQAFLSTYGWQSALALLAFGSIAMLFAAGGLRGRMETSARASRPSARRSPRPASTPAISTSPPASSCAAGTSPSSRCICPPIWPTAASRPRSPPGAWRWSACST